jgi:hypothetical protein
VIGDPLHIETQQSVQRPASNWLSDFIMSFKDTSIGHVEKKDGQAEYSSQEDVPVRVQDWDDAEEQALMYVPQGRTISAMFSLCSPMLCLVFGASLLDRSNISSAYVAGMSKDLELTIGMHLSSNPLSAHAKRHIAHVYPDSTRESLLYCIARFLPNVRIVRAPFKSSHPPCWRTLLAELSHCLLGNHGARHGICAQLGPLGGS